MNNLSWPLAVSTFNWRDRLKICSFFLESSNRWTQDKYVKKFEKVSASFVGSKYAVMVSSGSSANQLIAQQVKDRLVSQGEWPRRNQVIVGAVTWQTNLSVWVREEFYPIFIDVTLDDFCLNYEILEKYLEQHHDTIACVFPTSVLGFTPNINRLLELQNQYPDIKFALDNCENFFSSYLNIDGQQKNICHPFTSTTSGFVAHHWNCGGEAGLIFTNNQEEYEYFLLARAHGLQRNLWAYEGINLTTRVREKYRNRLVDSQFDFQVLSSNYRSTDIIAYLSLLDSKKWAKHKARRLYLYNSFYDSLDLNRYLLPNRRERAKIYTDIAFCLPIITKEKNIEKIKYKLQSMDIEQRPFISGNMLRQKNYQQYGDYENYSNAEYLHNHGIYVGLHPHLQTWQIEELCVTLNNI